MPTQRAENRVCDEVLEENNDKGLERCRWVDI